MHIYSQISTGCIYLRQRCLRSLFKTSLFSENIQTQQDLCKFMFCAEVLTEHGDGTNSVGIILLP